MSQSAGKLLQKERLSQNRTLTDIAGETCISSRYLDAIEKDEPKILPGDFFYRSFIRQYASALKLDPQAIGHILRHAVPTGEADPLPAFTMAYQTAKMEGQLSGLYRPRTAVAVVLLATVLIGCSGLYAIWRKAQVAEETASEAPATVQNKSVTSAPADSPAGDNQAEPKSAEQLETVPPRRM